MHYVLSLTPDELAVLNAALDWFGTEEAKALRERIRHDKTVSGEWKHGEPDDPKDEQPDGELYVEPKV